MSKPEYNLTRRIVLFIVLLFVVVFEIMITLAGTFLLGYIFQDNIWISGSIIVLGFLYICVVLLATVKWFYTKVPT